MAQPVQLYLDTALQCQQAGRRTSSRKAHEVLKGLREVMTAPATQPGGPLGYTQEAHVFHFDASQGDFIG